MTLHSFSFIPIHNYFLTIIVYSVVCVCALSVSYCMVCVYVLDDNPRALASGLSPIHTHSHTTFLSHQHACALCTLQDI